MNEQISPQPQRTSLPLPLHRPVATWVLLAAIGLAFLAQTLAGGSTDVEVLVRMGAKVTPLIADGEYWRLFTSMFLHIGVAHLFFNGYALLAIGTELERFYGTGRFLAIYLLSGLFGSLASYAFNDSLAAGASGAIFGLIGALGSFFFLHRESLGNWGRSRLINVVILVAINLFFGFTQSGIDNLAHMGGLICGLLLGWTLAPRYEFDPLALHVVDRNRLGRYWPAVAAAVVLFLGGTVLATMIHANSSRSHLFRGQQAIEREAWAEAAAELELALVEDPSLADADLYFYLGLARNYTEAPQQAVEAYEAALELDPNHSPALWNLALTHLQLSRYRDARARFETYLLLNPDETEQVQPYLDELRRLGQ